MSDLPSLFDLTDRVALVTGGAGLLGAEFCRSLAAAGARVVVADLSGKGAQDVADSIHRLGNQALRTHVDVSDPASVESMMAEVLEAYGQLDVLVNSAAIDPKFDPQHSGQHRNAFEDLPLGTWNQALAVNLTGSFLCAQAAAKAMLPAGGGVIINICSIYGMLGPDQRIYQREGQPPEYKPITYSVTKAGVLGLTKYLATYYAGKNIRVNALTTGGVFNDHDEAFVKAYSSRAVMGRMAEKDELNGALLFLASDASKYMTGANLVVDGGWAAW